MKSYIVLLGEEEIREVTNEGSPILSTLEQTVREKGHTLLPVGMGNIAKVLEWEPSKIWVPAILDISHKTHSEPAFLRDRLMEKFKTAVMIVAPIETVVPRFAAVSGRVSLFPRSDLPHLVSAAIEYDFANLHRRELTLKEIVAAVASSKSALERLFDKVLDRSVIAQLSELRSKQLHRLAIETSFDNLGLGLAVGYDEKYVSEVFKLRQGKTMREHRRRLIK